MSTKLTYTRKIKGNKLNMTEMELGTSISGTVRNVKVEERQGKNGTFQAASIELEVKGFDAPITLFTSGNVKAAVKKNAIRVGDTLVATRQEDFVTKNGFNSPSFDLVINGGQNKSASVAAKAPVAAKSSTTPTQEELMAEVERLRANAKGN